MLGERLPYVLLPGAATQDEAAEDPLTAAKAGSPANYELYWRNKLHRPLSELFATCLTPTALQHLLNGPHTLVKVDLHSTARGAVPGSKKQSKGRQTGLNQFFKGCFLPPLCGLLYQFHSAVLQFGAFSCHSACRPSK